MRLSSAPLFAALMSLSAPASALATQLKCKAPLSDVVDITLTDETAKLESIDFFYRHPRTLRRIENQAKIQYVSSGPSQGFLKSIETLNLILPLNLAQAAKGVQIPADLYLSNAEPGRISHGAIHWDLRCVVL